MKNKNLYLWKSFFFLVIFLLCSGCKNNNTIVSSPGAIVFEEAGGFGDSKLVFSDNALFVFATLNGKLVYRKVDSNFVKTSPEIIANWFSIIYDKGVFIAVVGSFKDKSVRVYKIDPLSGEAILASKIAEGEELKIDPALTVHSDVFLATYTEIKGNVNNGNTDKENGEYSVKLFSSKDLKTWEHEADIIVEKSNLEDGRLVYDGFRNELYFVFEKEIFDKGHSSINIIKSNNLGESWYGEKILLPSDADQEPGAFMVNEDSFVLYYSSDIDNGGVGSYEHSNIKKAVFDIDFSLVSENINILNYSSVLLMDVLFIEKENYYLFFKNYSTPDKKLILYKIDK